MKKGLCQDNRGVSSMYLLHHKGTSYPVQVQVQVHVIQTETASGNNSRPRTMKSL